MLKMGLFIYQRAVSREATVHFFLFFEKIFTYTYFYWFQISH